MGFLPLSFRRTEPGAIWLHAVSVGEVAVAVRLMDEICRINANLPVYLSTTTIAGREMALKKAAGRAAGIFYAPIDYNFAVRRALRTIRPSVLVVMETEIWPVLYRNARRAGCDLLVMNGRISDRALPRYKRFRWAFQAVLSLPSRIFVQSEQDRKRFVLAGAPADCVEVLGNLKYDAAPVWDAAPVVLRDMVERLRPDLIWVAASTMPPADASDVDEDDVAIEAFRQMGGGQLLILAPRKPERFEGAAAKLRAAGVRYMRRTENRVRGDLELPCVFLLDSIGELASVFPLADVVFMGGTLARRGGHNVLEPAACGKPIVVGPHMENFADIARAFRDEWAWMEIADGPALADAVRSQARGSALGARGAAIAARNTGVAARAAAAVLEAQDWAIPDWKNLGERPVFRWLLAQLWKVGNERKQRKDAARARCLDKPVISIGGIAMGGAGKTPFAAMLARRLREQGRQPGILTRGYQRRSLDKHVLIRSGEMAPTWLTGDEAQILLQAGDAHIGIGGDRWKTGRLLQDRFPADVFVLDDGFQHRRLRRDVDIVLIDSLNPFPGRYVFPLGGMREPMAGLARASAFRFGRGTQPGRSYAGICEALRNVNPRAPIFRSRVRALGWSPAELQPGPVAAFCGLGNPAAFWRTLRELGFELEFTWVFGDHHRYRPHQLERLGWQARERGLKYLVTTEKDAMNLPERARELVGPVELRWLVIESVVEEMGELLELVGRRGDHDSRILSFAHRYEEGGLDGALYEKGRPGAAPLLEDRQKQRVIAMVCSDPPEGYAR